MCHEHRGWGPGFQAAHELGSVLVLLLACLAATLAEVGTRPRFSLPFEYEDEYEDECEDDGVEVVGHLS